MGKANQAGRGSSFEAFAPRHYEFEIISPDGDTLVVEMRDVTSEELIDATRELRPPSVPLKYPPEFVQGADGKPTARLDPDDPAYLKALMSFRQRQMAAQILTVWITDVPGQTDDEKIDSVIALPSWAMSGLWKCCMMVTAVSEDRIKQRTFRPGGEVETPDSGPARVD